MQERAATAVILLGLVLVPPAAAANELRFGTPATLAGSVSAEGLQWAAVLMDVPGTTSSIENASTMMRREVALYSVGESRVGPNSFTGYAREVETAGPAPLPASFALQSNGPSSLYAEGRLDLALDSVDAVIEIPPGDCLVGVLHAVDINLTTRSDRLCPATWPAVVVRLHSDSSVNLEGSNVTRLEWHGMKSSCPTESCPPGGDRENVSLPLPPPNYERMRRHYFENATGEGASFRTAGPASLVVFGGSLIDLQVNGWVRLPLASGESTCDGCITPENQTFFAAGNLTVNRLSMDGHGGLKAQVDGDYSKVRFDEAPVDPKLLGPILEGAAVVATTVAAAVIAKLLFSALFTKRAEGEVLQNERRRRLYEVVEQHPGIHFREALRKADLPSGSGRFHLTQLVRVGLLAERRVGPNVRLFAGAPPTGNDWADRAALRDERFRPILEWIAERPDSTQKDILDGLKSAWGWNPSTTQGRLSRLVANGVLSCVEQGRFKRYRLARPLAAGAPHSAV